MAVSMTKAPSVKLPPRGWALMAGAGGAATLMVKSPVTLRPVASANSQTVMAMGKLPTWTGTPLMKLVRDCSRSAWMRPAGSAPAMVQVESVAEAPSRTVQEKFIKAPPVTLTVEEPLAGEVWETVVTPLTASNAPSPAMAVTVQRTASVKPEVEMTRASGRSFSSGERWRSSSRELRWAGTPRRCRRVR